MATGNILSAQINVTAPGAKEAFATVSNGAKTTEAQLKKVTPEVKNLSNSLETLRAKMLARQSFLLTETDVNKISQYNREIKLLKTEIAGIESIGVQGASGLAAIGTGATKAFSALRQVAYILPGIGIAGILGGLTDLVIGLFNSGNAAEKSSEKLELYRSTLERLSDEVDQFKTRIDVSNEIQGILSKVTGTSKVTLLQSQLDGIKKFNKEILSEIERLQSRFKDIDADEDLSDKDREKAIDDNHNEIEKLNKQWLKNLDDIKITEAKIEAQRFEDAQEAAKKRKKLLEDELDFQNRLRFALRKAMSELLSTDIAPTPDKQPFIEQISRMVEGIQKGIIANPPTIDIPVNLSPQFEQNAALVEDFTKKFQAIGEKLPPIDMELPVTVNINILNDALKTLIALHEQAKKTATIVSDVLGSAFDSMFNSIEKGGNKLKAFFDGLMSGIKQLISQLIRAALYAAILSAITGGKTTFISGFKSALGFAEGGYTGDGGKYQPAGIVHKGEFVIPANAVQRIGLGALNNLAFGQGIRGYANGGFVSGGGISSGGGMTEHKVVFEIQGQKLVGVLSLANKSLSRLT